MKWEKEERRRMTFETQVSGSIMLAFDRSKLEEEREASRETDIHEVCMTHDSYLWVMRSI